MKQQHSWEAVVSKETISNYELGRAKDRILLFFRGLRLELTGVTGFDAVSLKKVVVGLCHIHTFLSCNSGLTLACLTSP